MMSLLTTHGLTKCYSQTSLLGDKIRIYDNPYWKSQSESHLNFIQSLTNKGYTFSSDFANKIRTNQFMMKQAHQLSPVSLLDCLLLQMEFINSLPPLVSVAHSLELLNLHCNVKIKSLSHFNELEAVDDKWFRFKNQPDNPMRVRLTSHGQLSWEVHHEGLKAEHLANTIEFTMLRNRKVHLNAEPYSTVLKEDRIPSSHFMPIDIPKEEAVSAYLHSKMTIHWVAENFPRLPAQHVKNIDFIDAWHPDSNTPVANLWATAYQLVAKAFNDREYKNYQMIDGVLKESKPLIVNIGKPAVKKILPQELTKIPYISPSELIGRQEELSRLRARLELPNSEIVQINGIAGIGKTMLARDYITQYHQNFKHVFWIDGSSKGFLYDFVMQPDLASHFNIDIRRIKDEMLPKIFNKICRELSRFHDVPCLFVFDNVQPELSKWYNYIPRNDNWQMLATSRAQVYKTTSFPLQELNNKEAHLLFQHHLKNQSISDEAISLFIQSVDYHPLAIELVAKTAAQLKLTGSELLTAFKDNLKADIELGYNQGKAEHINTYLQSKFNIDNLDSQEQFLLTQFLLLPNQYFTLTDLRNLLNENSFNQNYGDDLFASTLDDLYLKGFLHQIDKMDPQYKLHSVLADGLKQFLQPTPDMLLDLIPRVSQQLHDYLNEELIEKLPAAIELAQSIQHQIHSQHINSNVQTQILHKNLEIAWKRNYDHILDQEQQLLQFNPLRQFSFPWFW